MSLTTRCAAWMSMLKPSSRSLRRAALRSISLRDIEDRAVLLHGHLAASGESALVRLAVSLLERDREHDVRVVRMPRERDLDHLLEGDGLVRDGVFRAIDDDRNLLVGFVFVCAHMRISSLSLLNVSRAGRRSASRCTLSERAGCRSSSRPRGCRGIRRSGRSRRRLRRALPSTDVKKVFVFAFIDSITCCRVHRQVAPPRWVIRSWGLSRGCLLMHVTCTSATSASCAKLCPIPLPRARKWPVAGLYRYMRT